MEQDILYEILLIFADTEKLQQQCLDFPLFLKRQGFHEKDKKNPHRTFLQIFNILFLSFLDNPT